MSERMKKGWGLKKVFLLMGILIVEKGKIELMMMMPFFEFSLDSRRIFLLLSVFFL